MKKKKKLRIAIFSDSFFPTIDGVVTSIVTTANVLSKKGHSVMIFAPKPPKKQKLPLHKKVRVSWIRAVSLSTYGQYRVSPPVSFSAQKKFEKFAPDVVHCHTPFSLGWIGLGLGKKLGVSVIATYHTLLPDFLVYLPIPYFNKSNFAKKIAWAYTNFFYNQADLVTTPSKAMASQLKKHDCPAIALSNPIQFSFFNRYAKTKRPSLKKELRLVYFGRISFEKNLEVLIESLKFLLAKKIPVKLVLVGDGPARKSLKKTAKNLGVSKKVLFTGMLRHQKLAKRVASCHIMVTPSTIETQGLTIIEGMAAGLPCVGTNFLAIPVVVKNGQNGFLFPPFDPKACAEKIEKIYRSKSLYKKLSKNAVKTAKPYAAETIALEWEKTYSKIARKKSQ
ncbi:glycosyltransferase [Candidatus Micrarchaeota archaeon]|nr:glycosyltransferase [Candidatus Micrarchaeota archaeon]MBU1929913.1 glycosyltransferase [Candidatus Micrarchaeota archaeon]